MFDSISTKDVNNHYAAEHLVENFERILRESENDLLEPHKLAPFDQFHIGGEAATLALAELAGIDATSRILDVGGGLAVRRARLPRPTAPRSSFSI